MQATPHTALRAGSPVLGQPVLVHSHIFKNAGSSLDRLLAECFGAGWASYEPMLPVSMLDIDDTRAFLAARPTVRAVSSHLPLGLLSVPNSVPMIMLRHPIDRARSVFQFLRRDVTQEDHAVARGSFADYVKWALGTPGKGVAVRNYQVFHLSSARLRPDNPQMVSTREDLAEAEALLTSLPAFGLVRRFADSCRVFEASYASLFPQLRLYDVHENTSADGISVDAEATEAARKELGETVFASLWEANKLDLALYRLGCTLFEKRLQDGLRHAPDPARPVV
jgi:hypothetical protein